MKAIRILFLAGLMSANCHSMSKEDLLRALQQRHQTQNRDMITLLCLAAGAIASEGCKGASQCGDQCGISYYLPYVPAAILLAHGILSDYCLRK